MHRKRAHGAIVKGIYPIWRELLLRRNRWALKEMGAAHPDAPSRILRIHELEQSHD